MTRLAMDLAARGYVAWNVEYRRVGQDGGGWPGTLEDVDSAVDALGDVPKVDPERVAAVGHSAGGHLALWLAARRGARVRLRGAISLAGVVDLELAYREDLGDGAIARFVGGTPEAVPDRYRAASPARLVPVGVPHLLVHGGRDGVVPATLSRSFAEAARSAGNAVDLVELPDADHFDVIDPEHEAWMVVVEALPHLLGT